MNLKISGHHLEVTPAIREYVITKLDRVLRHSDQVIDGTVILSVDNHKEKDKQQRAEINLHLKGKDIFVESANGNLYAAIDLLIDKLDRRSSSTWSVCKRTRTTRSSFNRRSTRSNCRRNNLHRNTHVARFAGRFCDSAQGATGPSALRHARGCAL